MNLELLHTVPTPNLFIHGLVLLCAFLLLAVACVIWMRTRHTQERNAWMFIALGAFLLCIAEYIDLYTPTLGIGIGLQQYFVHTNTFLAFCAFFVGWRTFFVGRMVNAQERTT